MGGADGDEREEFSVDVEDMISLLDRYRQATALLNTFQRGSREYLFQLKVERDLSRQIHEWGRDRVRGVRD